MSTIFSETPGVRPWSPQKAYTWYFSKPWLMGCNYAPSTSVNQLEMWEKDSFDLPTIKRELGWAKDLGFNTIRVFLHHLLWEHDPEGLKERMDIFLDTATENGIGVMFVIFDGVWNPFPTVGLKASKQGVHNSGWLQSPGVEILKDVTKHDMLERYVKGVIERFAKDERIHCWDLFNEPDNINSSSYGHHEPLNKADLSLMLLQKTFRWAREAEPVQPLTAGVWVGEWCDEKIKPLDRFMLEASDIITFHNYDNAEEMERRIKILQRFNRPILCTEYMARTFNSTFENILPILMKYNVGAYNWGFVAGKTQTTLPWDSWSISYNEPSLWFHDILHPDGKPYREEEILFLHSIRKESRSA
jgi:hypothetical protein